jgi:hypothetical protein
MDPCGTPALTVFQDDSFPFITTISLICVVQDPSLEKVRPRCLCVVTFLMGTLLK